MGIRNLLIIITVIFLLSTNAMAELSATSVEKALIVQVPDTEISVPFNIIVSTTLSVEIHGINLIDPPPQGVKDIDHPTESIYLNRAESRTIASSLKIAPDIIHGPHKVTVDIMYSDNQGDHHELFTVDIIVTDKNPEVRATITNPDKTLSIPVPKKGGPNTVPNSDSFSIQMVSQANQDVRIIEYGLYWTSIKPIDVSESTDFGNDPIIEKRKTKDYKLTFSVGPDAYRRKYEFDFIIVYKIGDDLRFIKVDPFLDLVTPTPTMPPDHLPGDKCNGEGCHSPIRGSSSSLYGLIMLSISLSIVGILVLIRKSR